MLFTNWLLETYNHNQIVDMYFHLTDVRNARSKLTVRTCHYQVGFADEYNPPLSVFSNVQCHRIEYLKVDIEHTSWLNSSF